MEGFEHVVKVALESEKFIVAGNLKFYVKRKTSKKSHDEYQTHGYEIDLVGARSDRLVLASVKSYFGSRGVSRQGFRGLADESKHTKFKGHLLFNEEDVRKKVIEKAASLYGYDEEQIEMRLYVGKFANDSNQAAITEHLGNIHAGAGPIRVFDLNSILSQVRKVLKNKTYSNDPVVALLRALEHGGQLKDEQCNSK